MTISYTEASSKIGVIQQYICVMKGSCYHEAHVSRLNVCDEDDAVLGLVCERNAW